MANSLNAAKVTGAPTAGIGYTYTLHIQNLDDLLLGFPLTDTIGTSVTVNNSGIEWVKSCGTPADLSTEEAAAWHEWIDDYTPPSGENVHQTFGFLFKGWLRKPAIPNDEQALYKFFGYVITWTGAGPPYHTRWVGDTEWSLPGSYVVNNLEMRLNVTNHES